MTVSRRFSSALEILSTAMVLVAGGALLWKMFVATPQNPAQPPQVEDVKGLRIDRSLITNVTGSGDIAIVEFSDFQCPFCGQYARQIWPEVKRTLVESGKVRYVSLHFPIESIHPRALQASEAAECAGAQGHFWPMRELLYKDPLGMTTNRFGEYARSLGLDHSAFERCLKDGAHLDRIRSEQAEGRRLGVLGTPAFFIGTVLDNGGIELRRVIRGSVSAQMFAEQVTAVRTPGRSASLR